MIKLKVVKVKAPRRKPVWWIEGMPEYYVDIEGPYVRCGPYDSYQEAREDKNGMQAVFNELEER